MPDPANEVGFERAAEILEVSLEHLEQLLDTGVLRGYRRGSDVVFRREDLADFITSGSARFSPPTDSKAQGKIAAPAGSDRRKSVADAKKSAMKSADVPGMFSAKQFAFEHGMLDDEDDAVARPSPFAGMNASPASPAPVGSEPPQAPPSPELTAENEALKARLKAAEEVLHDLQARCETLNTLKSENETMVQALRAHQTAQAELEAKLAAYEDLEPDASADVGWAATRKDPADEMDRLRKESVDLKGSIAAIQRKLDDAQHDIHRYRSERDDLERRMREMPSAGNEIKIKRLEKELEELSAERDELATEAEAAKKLRGEIERASELEDKLNTQREIIEAAQARLEQLEAERDEFESKARSLEDALSAAEAEASKVSELERAAGEAEEEIRQSRQKIAQLDARSSTLRAERDGLTEDLEEREAELAALRGDAEKGRQSTEALEKTRADLQEALKLLEAAKQENFKVSAQLSLRDQLIKQLQAEERTQGELEADNSHLRARVAEMDGRINQLEARVESIRGERDGLAAEIAKTEGAIGELRGQAERSASLLADNKALKAELEAVRDKAATLDVLQAERDDLAAKLRQSRADAEELERKLQSQERNLGSIQERMDATPVDDRLRKELDSLRGEIAKQMQELGQVRAQGEEASSRKRSALDVAKGRQSSVSARRSTAQITPPGGKPSRLGRFDIGDEIGKNRAGTLYLGTMPPGRSVTVLVLHPELTRDRVFLDRFWREMRTVSELESRQLLSVLDVGEASGIHYIAYESGDGETLEAILRRDGRLDPARAVGVASQLAKGLAMAAAEGIVHGDLKPENALVCEGDVVKVTGLGLYRGGAEDGSTLSERGRVEHYGAPEVIREGDREARTDVYSVGAVLYRMVGGEAPLEAGSLGDIAALVEMGELPRPLALEHVPDAIKNLLAKAMAEKPEDRFASAAELASALDALSV